MTVQQHLPLRTTLMYGTTTKQQRTFDYVRVALLCITLRLLMLRTIIILITILLL